MINSTFWHGKKVFLTGHTGFKGSWLSRWLISLGANVRGFALDPPTVPSLFNDLDLALEMDSDIGDIRDARKLTNDLVEFCPEIVFHLAAQPLVRLSYVDPRTTYETNVMGTLNLYEAVRSSESVRAVISVTTDKCYENREQVWGYRENDPMGGYDPYSSSKGCAELLSSAYRNSYFNPDEYGKKHSVSISTVRAGNVIGGGDWAADRLVPDCVRALTKGEEIIIRSPHSIRPWQHVLEPLSGYLTLAERMYTDGPSFGGAWNFGPGDEGAMDVESVVKAVIESWGSGSYRIAEDASLHEARLLKLDISKARAFLGWKPLYSTLEAIANSITLYRELILDPVSAGIMLDSQIDEYICAIEARNQ